MSRETRKEFYNSKVSNYCNYDEFVLNHSWFDSPIEELFYWCFTKLTDKNLYLIPQVDFNDLPYRADFVVGGDYETENGLTLIVECDGHDYHSSKEQIKKDNERQREIENLGYTFIRFSGSEIYNDVEKCVEETFKKIEFLRQLNNI